MFAALIVFLLLSVVALVYGMSFMILFAGIRENFILTGCKRVVKIGRITHKVEGKEVRPCDNIYMVYYRNGKKRRVVEASNSNFAKQLSELAA